MNAQTRFFKSAIEQEDSDDASRQLAQSFYIMLNSIYTHHGVGAVYNFIVAITPAVEELTNEDEVPPIVFDRPNN